MVTANILKGMKAISSYVGYSEVTLLKHKREFPAMPINKVGGEWMGNPVKLEQFYQDVAAGDTRKWMGEAREAGDGKAERKTGQEG
ncbi:MAG: hypothetical protein HY910_13460 [Desulfarculus sp.]|nr:hypothetical protein [Desulfarculus sp.]